MKYILIRKNVKQNEMYLSSVFKGELGEVFSNLSSNTFELELTGKIYVLDYKFSNKQNGVYHLGGMNEAQVIENALYEMTISQLEDYLFKPYSELKKP